MIRNMMGALVGRAQGSCAIQVSAQGFEHAIHGDSSLGHSSTTHVLASFTFNRDLLGDLSHFHIFPMKFMKKICFFVRKKEEQGNAILLSASGKWASNKQKG